MSDTPHEGSHDFDFLFGTWRIRNRRLTSRLTSCNDWEEFGAESICRPILGGLGNIDAYRPLNWPGREGFEGGTLRLYDRDTGLWRLYWMTNTSGVLDVPVVGRFTDGVGTFECEDVHDGCPVLCRFLWHGISDTTAIWEQALSPDNGSSWETNWIMELTRVS